jgi:hypothetical protein
VILLGRGAVLGIVASAHVPSYLVGRDLEDITLSQPGGNVSETPSQQNKPIVVVHVHNPSYTVGVDKNIAVQADTGKNETRHKK